MFFDPTCKPETKADPFSLDSLIAWLEKQPANKTYDFGDIRGCLACRYIQSTGISDRPWESYPGRRPYRDVFGGMEGYTAIAYTGRHTFGAALQRARALRTQV